jgi:hypothetical protein
VRDGRKCKQRPLHFLVIDLLNMTAQQVYTKHAAYMARSDTYEYVTALEQCLELKHPSSLYYTLHHESSDAIPKWYVNAAHGSNGDAPDRRRTAGERKLSPRHVTTTAVGRHGGGPATRLYRLDSNSTLNRSDLIGL